MLELERSVENPHDKDRIRVIEGKDLKPAELHAKIEEVQLKSKTCLVWFVHSATLTASSFLQLEVRLAEKEESLLERDLIFEQVSRLSDRIKSRADAGKNDTLTLAKDVRHNTTLIVL